jgi:glycosyltransferase involved in cell wall biosynthesis
MTTLSVCVSTHERPHLLRRALEALADQTRPADEIVVSDSSILKETEQVIREFLAVHPGLNVQYVRSGRNALPWNRWVGFLHSVGDVVLFLDDDIRLAPSALSALEQEYQRLQDLPDGPPAGIGFQITGDNGDQPMRNPAEFRERWLGTSGQKSGTMTLGGLPVSSAGLSSGTSVSVDHLSGGAMSYRREALAHVGFLEGLAELYDAGIGRAEDTVLSTYARRQGNLYLITRPFALHPVDGMGQNAPYATGGWRMGLSQTWGRAHTLRWTASDWSAYKRMLLRVISLELLRCLVWIARRPWRWSAWQRMWGAFYGIAETIIRWRRIPSSARDSMRIVDALGGSPKERWGRGIAAASRAESVTAHPQERHAQAPGVTGLPESSAS